MYKMPEVFSFLLTDNRDGVETHLCIFYIRAIPGNFSLITAIVAYVIVLMYVFYYLRVTSEKSITGNSIVYG